jgi:hypothetical protein
MRSNAAALLDEAPCATTLIKTGVRHGIVCNAHRV